MYRLRSSATLNKSSQNQLGRGITEPYTIARKRPKSDSKKSQLHSRTDSLATRASLRLAEDF